MQTPLSSLEELLKTPPRNSEELLQTPPSNSEELLQTPLNSSKEFLSVVSMHNVIVKVEENTFDHIGGVTSNSYDMLPLTLMNSSVNLFLMLSP
jgi:hypothetical protein